jgi:nitrate/nitrite transport system substrate-binding protein
MKEMGLTPPSSSYKSVTIMGKTFDPSKPMDYLKSFKIKKAA